MDRQAARQARAARRADLTGSGPTRDERAMSRFPGATGAFALFGEVLLIGLIVTALSVFVVTLPLAIAVGSRHLRRYLHAEGSGWRPLVADVRDGLWRSLPVGLGVVLFAGVLAIDYALVVDGLVPGAPVVGVLGVLAAAAAATALVCAARVWTPEGGWGTAFRDVPVQWRRDPAGAAFVLAAVVFVLVVAWQLPPLVVPGLGCLVFAAVAAPERRRTVDAGRQ